MCCIDRIIDFKPSGMPDLGISLDVVFHPGFDICVSAKNVYVVFDLPDISMPYGPRYIIKKLGKGVAYNRARNELYVWLTDDDLLKMRKSRVSVQVSIYDIFDCSMVGSTIQQINIDPIVRKRCTYSTSFTDSIVDDLRSDGKFIKLDKTKSVEFTVDAKDGNVERFMNWLKYGDCNQNERDDSIDALRYASESWIRTKHDVVGKVTTIEQTKDGLKFTIEKEKPMKTKKDIDRIVITKNDLNEVLLRAYSNDEIVEKTIAKCNPNDIFDFNIGAKLAVDRLYDGYDMTPKPKRKLYNGKIFIRSISRELGYYWFPAPKKYEFEYQTNKLYNVVNGKITGLETRVEDLIYDDMRDDELGDILKKTNAGSGRMFLQFIDGYFVR